MDPATLIRETVLVPRNTPRPLGPDDWAAERIRRLREDRDWSTAELARRITMAGVPMLQQTVWKIESGTPRRKLSVGEAYAFASIFEVTIAELLTPPAQDVPDELVRLAAQFRDWRLLEGKQAADLARISDRIDELGEYETYTADVVATYSDLTADQAIADLETIIANYQTVLDAIHIGGSAWKVIASAAPVAPPTETAAADGAEQ